MRDCSNDPFHFITGELTKKTSDILEKYLILNTMRKKIIKEVYEKFNIGFFQALCYTWASYTITLIVSNPNLNPYDIIKYNFYQTSNINEMKKIFDDYKLGTMNYLSDDNFFSFDLHKLEEVGFLEYRIKYLEEKRDSIIEKLSNPILIKHQKMLYVKIMNFLTLVTKYNLTINPNYLDIEYRDVEKGLSIYDSKFMKYDPYDESSFIKKIKEHKKEMEEKTKESIESTIKKTKKIFYRDPYSSKTINDIINSIKIGETPNSLYRKIIAFDLEISKRMKQDGGAYKYKYDKYIKKIHTVVTEISKKN